jgi:heat shock protein HslJ
MGELSNQGEGVWLAQIDEIGRDANGFTQLSSTPVEVAIVSGVEETASGESEATPEATDMSNELVGTNWQWVQTAYGDDSVVVADDPSRYTLFFDENGQVAVRFDCNGGGGSYVVDGSSLLFGPLVTTLMACPEDSQATIFAKDLAEVYSYVIEDGRLYLSLKLDTGIMEFEPVEQEAGTPTAQATEEPSEEAT